MDSAYGLGNLAVAGYSSGDVLTGSELKAVNLNSSNTVNIMNLDSMPGNMKGNY